MERKCVIYYALNQRFKLNDGFNASDRFSLPWTTPYTSCLKPGCTNCVKIYFVCLRSKHTAWICIPLHYSCRCDSMDFNNSWIRARSGAQQTQREISIGFLFLPWIIPLKIPGQTFSCHKLASFHSTRSWCLHKYRVTRLLFIWKEVPSLFFINMKIVFNDLPLMRIIISLYSSIYWHLNSFYLEVTIIQIVTAWEHSRLTWRFSN